MNKKNIFLHLRAVHRLKFTLQLISNASSVRQTNRFRSAAFVCVSNRVASLHSLADHFYCVQHTRARFTRRRVHVMVWVVVRLRIGCRRIERKNEVCESRHLIHSTLWLLFFSCSIASRNINWLREVVGASASAFTVKNANSAQPNSYFISTIRCRIFLLL